MSTVITVENLGKKYTLRHQSGQQPYVALRDVIAERAAAIGRKLLHPFSFSPLTPHSSQEEFWALKDVSFEVKQGDRIGIIGRNGAGKSTLLKILSRIIEPTTGSVRIKGRVASLLEVGTGFHPELTGRENIYLNGAILGMTRAEIKKKFDEIVDFAEIEKFLDTPVKRYSSGMYVRLAFAVAAHLEPEILVVDEVLAVGDAQFQKKCLGKMEDVSAKEGRTLLFVCHSMESIRKLCNVGIYMDRGRNAFTGDVDVCVNCYQEKNFTNQRTILSHCTNSSNRIEVEEIFVNGEVNDLVALPAGSRSLDVRVVLNVLVSTRITLEVRILDFSDNVIANFCPSHYSSELDRVETGRVEISATLQFPRFTQGDYYMSIFLTDPGKEGLLDFPHAVRVMAESEPMTMTGDVLVNRLGHGALILDGSTEYKRI